MTREEAISYFKGITDRVDDEYDELVDASFRAIKVLDAQPEWISCSDGLPDMNQIVVVVNKDKKTWDFGQFRGVDFIDQNGRYNWHWKKNTCRIVDYWMPKENAIRMPWNE